MVVGAANSTPILPQLEIPANYERRQGDVAGIRYSRHGLPKGLPLQRVSTIIYTTNAIESVNSQLRKIIKTRGHFPSDKAASKLIWLALRNITAAWSRATKDWKEAMNQFAILYDDRFLRHPA